MYWLLLFIAAIALAVVLGRVLFPKDRSNAARLMSTYRVMTHELLDSTADDQLVKAVVANLLSKVDSAKKDAYAVIPVLSQERCAVYSVWLFRNEMKGNDPTVLHQSGQFGFSELAADGLDLLGFDTLAADLRQYLQTADDTLVASMKQASEDASLDAALVAFIRDHADAFCDGETV